MDYAAFIYYEARQAGMELGDAITMAVIQTGVHRGQLVEWLMNN